MAYPSTSDWTSAEPFATWWAYARGGGASDLCATSAAAALYRVRGGVALYGWTWDDELQNALVARAEELRRTRPGEAWGPVVSQLQDDGRRRIVSGVSLGFGLWNALYRPSGLRFDGVVVSPGTVPPAWGADAPGDANAETACWREGVDVRPELLNAAGLREAVAASRYGIRLRSGETPPAPFAPPSPPKPGLSGTQIALAGAAVVGVGSYLTWAITRRQRSPR